MGLAASAGMAGSLHAGMIVTGSAQVGPLGDSFIDEGPTAASYSISIDPNNSFSGDIAANVIKGDSVNVSAFSGLSVVQASNNETIGAGTTGWNQDPIEVDDNGSALLGLQLSEPGNQTLYGWMQISNSAIGGFNDDIGPYTVETANFSWDVQTDGGNITVNTPDAPAVPAEAAIAAAFLAGSALLFRRRQRLLAGSALE